MSFRIFCDSWSKKKKTNYDELKIKRSGHVDEKTINYTCYEFHDLFTDHQLRKSIFETLFFFFLLFIRSNLKLIGQINWKKYETFSKMLLRKCIVIMREYDENFVQQPPAWKSERKRIFSKCRVPEEKLTRINCCEITTRRMRIKIIGKEKKWIKEKRKLADISFKTIPLVTETKFLLI